MQNANGLQEREEKEISVERKVQDKSWHLWKIIGQVNAKTCLRLFFYYEEMH